MNKSVIGHGATFAAILTWDTTFIFTKVLLRASLPIEILSIRFLTGYLTLWLAFPCRLQVKKKRQKLYFMVVGLYRATLYYLFENIALTHTLASSVGVITSAAPFFTAICSYLFLYEKWPGRRSSVGFSIAMAGIGSISFGNDASSQLNPLGGTLALVAAVVWVVYSTIAKKISEFGYGATQTTRRAFFYGLLFVVPVLFAMNFRVNPEMLHDRTMVLNLLFLGLGVSTICFVTRNFVMRVLGAAKTTVYIYMVPVITTVTPVLILHERIS